MKDYVYIPLGGSRCSKWRNYWNIFVTFLVSGIWHGANWTFIVWGIWHGVAQIIEKALGQQNCNYGRYGKIVKIVVTFLIVNFAWVFFRTPSLDDAVQMIARMFDTSISLSVFLPSNSDIVMMGLGIIVLFSKEFIDEFYPHSVSFLNNRRTRVRWATYVSLMIFILLTGVFSSDQFIYANF